MSRKAVQGYSEKILYDNSRFTGILATSDPTQEGYFKHLVNLDVSDTGQSVTPRKGFLTTTLCQNTLQHEPINLSSHAVVFREGNLQKHVVYDFDSDNAYAANLSAYDVVNKMIVIDHKILHTDWADVLAFLRREIPEVDTYAGTVNAGQLQTYVRQHLVLGATTEAIPIVDYYLVHKVVVRASIVDTSLGFEYPFLLEIYYRKDAVGALPADTLIFGAVDTAQHPTYVHTERNIASPRSIIPDPLQVLYTTETRPAGHASYLGQIYAQDATTGDYMISHVYPNKGYLLRPHFDLDPASYAVNDETAKWAFRFDIVNLSSRMSTEDQLRYDTIFKGPWCKYINNVTYPTFVFPRSTAADWSNADLSLRHNKETNYVITLVPKTVVGGSTDSYETVSGYTYPTAPTLTNHIARYTTWIGLIDTVTGKKTFRAAIEALGATALFYVFKITDATQLDAEINGDFEVFPVSAEAVITQGTGTYASHFKTGTEVLEMIDDGTLAFSAGVTFRTLPYVSNDTYHFESDPTVLRWWFCDLTCWGWSHPSGRAVTTLRYNLFNGKSQQLFCSMIDSPEYEVRMQTSWLMRPDLMPLLPDMKAEGFFETGYSIVFYMRPYTDSEISGKTVAEIETIKDSWATSSYLQTTQLIYGYDDLSVTAMPLVLTQEPYDIQNATGRLAFQGNRLAVWKGNSLFISEPGTYYHFKEANRKTFSEPIVKVLEYKKILLVFTTQHLYAVYETMITLTTAGTAGASVQTNITAFASQRVLYNIMTSPKYADAIQIFNQAVLFYSEDGQLFMIKPNTVIDDETRFTLQYFNKSANDILINYVNYINERLADYNNDTRVVKTDVQIKALLSVNYIKLFYYVPGVITYVLVYDVINNRYYSYDTLTFSEISDKMYVESGEMYLTIQNSKTLFSFPYTEPNQPDNIVDMSYSSDFKKTAIDALIDTGDLNMNNHLMKRFRDLHVTFKNLSASKLLFNAETVLDGIVSHPYYDMQLQVQDVGGVSYFVTVPKSNANELIDLVEANLISEVAASAFVRALSSGLFENENILMDFSDYTSSKLLTHRASVLGMGKVFRLKLQFVSKGAYKIQNFGIIYKERRV